jgi:integrase
MAATTYLWRDPRSGIFYYRRRVPGDLRDQLGWMLKKSLDTRDLKIARRLFPHVASEMQRRLDTAQAEYAARLEHDDPGDPDWQPPDLDEIKEGFLAAMTPTELLEAFVDTLTPQQMWLWKRMQEPQTAAVAPVVSHAVTPAARQDRGKRTGTANGASLYDLLDQWASSRRKPARTAYAWRLIINKVVASVGHEDAERITKADLVRFRDAALVDGKSAKTVQDYLTCVRTVIQTALEDGRLDRHDNPAKGVKVLADAEQTTRIRPYSLEEAQRVLSMARQETSPELRYLPVLLFATGTRIAELAGCLIRDVVDDNGHGMAIEIRPNQHRRLKAPKTSTRTIPLPEWAAEEIREFVAERRRHGQPDDLLFADIVPSNGNIAGNLVKRWSWVVRRKAGVADETISPAHSARHLYADLCRDAGIDTAIKDRLLGHATAGLGARYGAGFSLEVLRRAVEKIQWEQLQP